MTEESVLGDLQRLVSYEGPEEPLAEHLAFHESNTQAVQLLQKSLRGETEMAEIQALRATVRILGTLAGDATGDTVPDVSSSGSPLAQALRCEGLTGAVLELLQRWKSPKEERPWLLLEGLRALRLLLVLPLSAKSEHRAGKRNTAAWWVEDDVGYVRHGEARRRLGEVLVTVLDEVKESSKAEMKAAAFGALQNLVTGSPVAFRHLAQGPVAEKVVLLTEAQLKSLPHAAVGDGCRLLTLLCSGPRSHVRRVADAQALPLAMEILKRLEVHPQVAPAAVVLLGVLCEAVDPQPGLLELCAGPAKQFSKQIRDELGWARAPVASAVLALLPEG